MLGALQPEAGLLVKGGYSHGCLRELVFDGVTERLLRGVDPPC